MSARSCLPAGTDRGRSAWTRAFRSRPCLLIVVLTLAVASAGCDSRPASDGPGSSTTPSTEAAGARLAPTGPELAAECRTAAQELGFAVPCPTVLPTVNGQVPDCGTGCAGKVGAPGNLHPIFFLEVADFDGGSDFGPVRHLVIEARPLSTAPPVPCVDGVPGAPLPGGVLTLDCPELVGAEAAKVHEGEAAHQGHHLAYFDRNGVRNVVSVHGQTPAAENLVATIIDHLAITEG